MGHSSAGSSVARWLLVSRPPPGSIAEAFETLADLQRQGLIRHLGLSNVSSAQLAEAQQIAPVVCIQNFYNLAHRADDAFVDDLARQGIAYVPFFPLGGFSPLQSQTLNAVAESLGVTPMQLALAWLLQRAPNIGKIGCGMHARKRDFKTVLARFDR